jgi:hypothetical protein
VRVEPEFELYQLITILSSLAKIYEEKKQSPLPSTGRLVAAAVATKLLQEGVRNDMATDMASISHVYAQNGWDPGAGLFISNFKFQISISYVFAENGWDPGAGLFISNFKFQISITHVFAQIGLDAGAVLFISKFKFQISIMHVFAQN